MDNETDVVGRGSGLEATGAVDPLVMRPAAWACFAETGNIRIWSPDHEPVKMAAEREGWEITPLYALPQWASMGSAPKDRRILVKSPSGEIYLAHWVQDPFTGDEAYCISEAPDGTQHLIHPVAWREIFA